MPSSQQSDPERARRLCQRAAAFAPDFMHWFAADGAAFGRSLTYRFCPRRIMGALAFADVEVLPWCGERLSTAPSALVGAATDYL